MSAEPGGPAEAGLGSSTGIGARYLFADVEFDGLSGELRVAGTIVEIEPRPLRLLAELLQHADEAVTKAELLDRVWDGRPTVDHVLANAVSKLRAVLGPAGAARVLTLPRVGYRLAGPVRRIDRSTPSSDFQAGQAVPLRPGYRLEHALGRGAQSDVWLARHATLGHMRVFKFADDGARLSALKREYTLYRLLRQELGAREDFAVVIDANFVAAPYFLECAYGGISLLEWAQAPDELSPAQTRLTAMPQPARIALFVQIARAVAAAHSVGVLHKDLKPGNVLVDGEPGRWQARLTDFGSGRLLDRSRLDGLKLTALGLTQTEDGSSGSLSGTLMYMAPEVLSGSSPSVQSDVYALGLMLYQLLVGDPNRPLAPGWQREFSEELLRDDIEQACDGKPELRLASAAVLADRLARLAERRQQLVQLNAQIQATEVERASARRRRVVLPWLVATVLALLVGSIASGLSYRRSESARQQAQAVSDFLYNDVLRTRDIVTAGSVEPVQLLTLMRHASRHAAVRFADQPVVEAKIRRRLAETFLRRSSTAEASVELLKAAKLLASEVAGDDTERLQVQFLQSQLWSWVGDDAKAEGFLTRASQIAGELRMSAMTELGAAATRARMEHLLNLNKPTEASAVAELHVRQVDALVSPDSQLRIDARQRLLETYIRADAGEKVRATLDELARPPFNAADVSLDIKARALWARSEPLMNEGRIAEAEQLAREVKALLMTARYPNAFYLGFIEGTLGDCLLARGDASAALQRYIESVQLFVASVGSDHLYVRDAQLKIGQATHAMGHRDTALAFFREVERWYVENVSPKGQGQARFESARVLRELGRAPEALAMLDTLDAKFVGRFDHRNDVAARVAGERGLTLLDLHRAEEALPLLRKAVDEWPAQQTNQLPRDHYAKALARAGGS